MKTRSAAILVFLFWALALAGFSFAQQPQQEDEPESNRRVLKRVVPDYPQIARELNLRGSVRVEVLVEPNGTVKSVQIKGGHPVLVIAAQDAVRKWKWEPATHETQEPVEFRFDPK
ncbi:MAG TPA: energy transducer TonB [Terriglobales bacterium]|nr:energy transducer TonB [Terriglobales bacterium]